MGLFDRFSIKNRCKPILDYVEGRMPITEFQKMFETNKDLRKLLKTRICPWYTYLKDYNYNLLNLFENHFDFKGKSWDTISNRAGIYGYLTLFLDDRKISYAKFAKYEEDYKFLIQIQPDWVDCQDDSILEPIIDSIPKDLSKTKRIAMGKEKIKALFKYDKSYPRWIQGAEWPIVNGKPLVFSHTENVDGNPEHKRYYFYDPDTNEQTVVEQFY